MPVNKSIKLFLTRMSISDNIKQLLLRKSSNIQASYRKMISNWLAVLLAFGSVASVVCRDIDINAYRQKSIECMNKHRRQHKVSPLKTNQQLTNNAQLWAQYLIDHNKFEHQGNIGENLYSYWARPDTPPAMDAACESWYGEEPLYDYKAGQFSAAAGHFTAMVWKGTTDVGVGIANKDGRYVVVANFSPSGNVIGHFIANVLPK